MRSVTMNGWVPGMQKVSLNHALQHYAGVGLKSAHGMVCDVVEGWSVTVQIESDKVNEFLQMLEEFGVIASADLTT
jgi:alcohol dehydrogenase class IV